MSPMEMPRPDDEELALLYECELYERYWGLARQAVEKYPETAARVIAEVWLQSRMLDALRQTG